MAEPVELYLERRHAFNKKQPNPVTGKKRVGCEVCGAGKLKPVHLGAPPTLNERQKINRMAYQSMKDAWTDAMADLVRASSLAPCEAVYVEAQVGFPTRAKCDEGNTRWMLEKALGDALVREGVIPDDTFYPVRRYTMGILEGVHTPGRSWLRVLVFESVAEVVPVGVVQAIERLPLVEGVG